MKRLKWSVRHLALLRFLKMHILKAIHRAEKSIKVAVTQNLVTPPEQQMGLGGYLGVIWAITFLFFFIGSSHGKC